MLLLQARLLTQIMQLVPKAQMNFCKKKFKLQNIHFRQSIGTKHISTVFINQKLKKKHTHGRLEIHVTHIYLILPRSAYKSTLITVSVGQDVYIHEHE